MYAAAESMGVKEDDGPNDENIGTARDNPSYISSLMSDNSINSQFLYSGKWNKLTEEMLQRNLKYFFMNPYEKWKARRKFPVKLILQFVKIVLVTVQLSLFGGMHSSYVTFVERNTIALKHLFLENWDPSYETLPYPPATGMYAIYKEAELYSHIDFAMKEYYDQNITEQMGIAGYQILTVNGTDQRHPMNMCITKFKDSKVFSNGSFVFNSEETTDCFAIRPLLDKNGTKVYDIKLFLAEHHESIALDVMLDIKIKFPLRTINLETYSKQATPKCYYINVEIMFDNQLHDGQLLVAVNTDVDPIICKGKILYEADNIQRVTSYTVFYVFVIFISLASMFLCIRSIYRAIKTQKVVVEFFRDMYDKKLSRSDRAEFVNLWYVLIIFNDIMTIIGTVFLLEATDLTHDATTEKFNLIGLLLGTGSLCTWFGVLRYIGFLKKYNLLLVTMKRAAPNVLRFLVCAGMMYFGFMFCGWVVLGPYHIKFRTLISTSECLFSLLNGDDMFVTFSALQSNSVGIWVYSQAYLYSFICLFIYIILSLFIAVIMDTYETIKNYYTIGFPKTELFEFIDKCADLPSSKAFCCDRTSDCWRLSPCCNRDRYNRQQDIEPVVT